MDRGRLSRSIERVPKLYSTIEAAMRTAIEAHSQSTPRRQRECRERRTVQKGEDGGGSRMYTNVGWRRDGIFLEKEFCSGLTLGLGRLAPRAHKAGAPRSSRAPAHYYPALSIASPTPAGRPPPRAGPASSGSVGSLGRGSH